MGSCDWRAANWRTVIWSSAAANALVNVECYTLGRHGVYARQVYISISAQVRPLCTAINLGGSLL